MINIAICDDDKVILSEIKNLLLNIAEKNFIKIDVNTYYDGSSLEKDINKGEVYKIVFRRDEDERRIFDFKKYHT